MATSSRPPSKSYDLEITIISAKNLKNVNWRNGDLKPYVIFWVEPDRRLATKSDESCSIKPVWNERFVLPLPLPPQDSLLTLEVFHSKPSETPKPLVGTLRVELGDLVDSDEPAQLKTFELRRPSGRPQGKIRLRLTLRDRPDPVYQSAPPSSYYYSTAPPPPPALYSERDYRGYNTSLPYTSHHPPPPPAVAPPPPPPASFSPPPPQSPHPYQFSGYSDPYSSYYPGYYSQQPQPQPPLPRPFSDRQPPSYGRPGPSAPVDYSPHDQKRGSRMGLGTGLAAGTVAGALGGLTLEEGIKYEEEKIAEKVESDMAAKNTYSNYRVDY